MLNSFYKISFVLLLFFLIPPAVFPQVLPDKCATDKVLKSSDNTNGTDRPLFPTSGTVRVLIIYCKFVDDYFDYPPYSDPWPGTFNDLPQWVYKTVSRSPQEVSHDPSITGYFEDMSMGRLKVVGDVCPKLIVPRVPSYYYSKAAGSDITHLTKEVLDKADPYVNYSDYDNYDPEDYNHNGIYNEPDGVADMIIICFRNVPIGIGNIDDLGNYSGIASLTGSQDTFPGGLHEIVKDGVRIKAGIRGSGTFQNGIFDPDGQLHIILHEIGHYMFSNTINHLYGTGYYTLMSGIGCGVMSAFEREVLGWIHPITVTKNMYNVALSDVIITGCAYKIPIPDPLHHFPLDLYVENYQSLSYYTTRWLRGHSADPTLRNTGVIISEANSSVYLSDIKCADGKWNWDRRMYLWFHPWILKDWLFKYPFQHIYPNPDSGSNEMQIIGERINRDDYTITTDHPDVLGDGEDFFNLGYNDVYSRWSNPNTFPYDSAHICVELTHRVFNTIYANFYVKDPVLAKPSKPQLWKIELVNGNYPSITWLRGREPDLVKYYIYKKSGVNGFWNNVGDVDRNTVTFSDPEKVGDTVFYKIQAIDSQGKQSVFSDVLSIGDGKPQKPEVAYNFSLSQNFPNPFNPATEISFSLQKAADIKLSVYNILGERVDIIFQGYVREGKHEVEWNGSNFPSGVYFYRLETPGLTLSRKMVLIK
jgi:M6 family metalloprotease-like protein